MLGIYVVNTVESHFSVFVFEVCKDWMEDDLNEFLHFRSDVICLKQTTLYNCTGDVLET